MNEKKDESAFRNLDKIEKTILIKKIIIKKNFTKKEKKKNNGNFPSEKKNFE